MNIKRYNNYSRPMDMKIVEKLSKESSQPINEDLSDDVDNIGISSMISELIKKEWEICDAINGSLIFAQEVNDTELESLLNDLLTDHYMHIGQLEGRVQAVVPEADAIDDGRVESPADYPEDDVLDEM